MSRRTCTMQIGKSGFNEGVFEILTNIFKTHGSVRISVLKAGGHSKEKVIDMAERIVEKLGKNYVYRVVGFTIFIRRLRK